MLLLGYLARRFQLGAFFRAKTVATLAWRADRTIVNVRSTVLHWQGARFHGSSRWSYGGTAFDVAHRVPLLQMRFLLIRFFILLHFLWIRSICDCRDVWLHLFIPLLVWVLAESDQVHEVGYLHWLFLKVVISELVPHLLILPDHQPRLIIINLELLLLYLRVFIFLGRGRLYLCLLLCSDCEGLQDPHLEAKRPFLFSLCFCRATETLSQTEQWICSLWVALGLFRSYIFLLYFLLVIIRSGKFLVGGCRIQVRLFLAHFV